MKCIPQLRSNEEGTLFEYEKFLIRELHTRIEEGGYNLTNGGEGISGRHFRKPEVSAKVQAFKDMKVQDFLSNREPVLIKEEKEFKHEPVVSEKEKQERIEQLFRQVKYLKGKAKTYKRLAQLEAIISELESY